MGAETITVRFYAGAAEAAGTEEAAVALTGAHESLDEVLERLPSLISPVGPDHGPALERVARVSSFLVNGVRTARTAGVLKPGDELDVLPPFAGG